MRSSLLLLAITLVLGAGAVSACDGGSASSPASSAPSSLAVPTRPDAEAPPSDAAADVVLPTDAQVDAADAGPEEDLDAGPPGPTFRNVYALFRRTCGSGCHVTGAAPSGSLAMPSRAAAYMALVGVDCAGPACAGGGRKRVVPNDPASSVLYTKIERVAPACGDPMPPQAGTELTPTEVALVHDWIMAGAPND